MTQVEIFEVEIFETGPRDGLQNEALPITVAQKVALVDLLSQAGFARIEAGSFVHPKRVPQMAGSDEVFAHIRRMNGVRYVALTPNMQGYERARKAGVDEAAIFASASEGFSRANLNCSIKESLERFRPLMAQAAQDGLRVRGYVSMVCECPFDGPVAPAQAARVAACLYEMGCHEISLGDTLGRAGPEAVRDMLAAVMEQVPVQALAGHYHDTSGQALRNIDVSYEMGIRVFDSAIGGLGGCPFAPGAAGNVATERLAAHFKRLGVETGLNPDILDRAIHMIGLWRERN